MRAFLLTLTTCMLVLPTQAQYSGGSGTADDPYRIATATDLIALGRGAGDSDKHFVLVNDIDLDPALPGRLAFEQSVISELKGVFDGNDSTISNLTITKGSLFGTIRANALVTNLAIVDANAAGKAILAEANYGTIRDCSSSGVVSSGGSGLVGDNYGSISGCHNSATVSGYGADGLVSYNRGHISHCYNSGTIDGAPGSAGGLVGSNNGIIIHCYNNGSALNGSNGGGLCVHNDGDLIDCYNTGAIRGGGNGGIAAFNNGRIDRCDNSARLSGEFVGGIAAFNYDLISNCYNTGLVTSDGDLGGVVAENHGSVVSCYSVGGICGDGYYVGGVVGQGAGDNVFQCFWNTESSGQADSAGGTGLTTAQMLDVNTYLDAGWDFVGETRNGYAETWQMPDEGGYPIFAASPGEVVPELVGRGTPDAPYLISTVDDLWAIQFDPNACYRLTASIEITPIVLADPAVLVFGGTLDGNGFAVEGLTISGRGDLGLFGRLSAQAYVHDLDLIDVNVVGVGTEHVGGLVGSNQGGRIANCHVRGNVSGQKYVGGLVGRNQGDVVESSTSGSVFSGNTAGGLVGQHMSGSLFACCSMAAVSSNPRAGGLVGENRGSISDCYATGTVSGSARSVGGLVGTNYPGADIIDCYSSGPVPGRTEGFGGLVGSNNGGVSRSFWDTRSSGQLTSDGGTGKTTAEMQMSQTFLAADWDFVDETDNGTEDIWWILESHDYPRLWWELIGNTVVPDVTGIEQDAAQDVLVAAGLRVGTIEIAYSNTVPSGYVLDQNPKPWLLASTESPVDITVSLGVPVFEGQGTQDAPYRLSSPAFFHYFANPENAETYWSAGVHTRLECDVDLANRIYSSAVIAPDGNETTEDFDGMPFAGTFDGNGFFVRNLTISGGTGHLGLFGRLSETATVKNLSVENAVVKGTGDYVAALAGFNAGGSISNCSSIGTVAGNDGVGGMVGSNGGDMSNCRSACAVTGHSGVGGLVGKTSWYGSDGAVVDCHSSGQVRGYWAVGGLAGSASYGAVTNCHSTSEVSGSYRVGGFMGDCQSTLSDCYSSGTVTALDHVGGFLGYLCGAGSVSNCYSAGRVTSRREDSAGGLIGGIWSGSVANCFWDTETAGTTIGYYEDKGSAGVVSNIQGLATADMQTAQVYLDAGWDFIGEITNGTQDTWWIDEGKDYPRLWWELLDEEPNESGAGGLPVGVYRLWSPLDKRHFYTIDDSEKKEFLENPAGGWQDEGVVYRAFADDKPNVAPVYRFFSESSNSYFYTISASERDKLVSKYCHVWAYEKIAFYVFPAGQQPADAVPVYRFWSDILGYHFYTAQESERDKLINEYSHVWTYETVAWYAYRP